MQRVIVKQKAVGTFNCLLLTSSPARGIMPDLARVEFEEARFLKDFPNWVRAY